MNVDDMTPAQRARFEIKREQEFYSYYEPIKALARNEMDFTDLNCEESVARHVPRPSTDRALTAFCQLAAIRMQMRRAMIFFFDTTHAYILAEATRTLSLQDDAVTEEEGDSLWLGSTRIPRGFSICESTTCLPSNQGSNSEGDDSDIIHIINNLTEDIRFCNRSYVVGGPRARFYAGVPITTPKGLKIGAFCVLDDKPHDGLASKEVGFLKEMGAAVMSHLDLIKAKVDQGRGADMVSALSAFAADDLNRSQARKVEKNHARSQAGPGQSRRSSLNSEGPETPSRRISLTNGLRGERVQSAGSLEKPKDTTDRPTRPAVLSQTRKRYSGSSSTFSTYVNAPKTRDASLLRSKHETVDSSQAVFQSAARLIRDAVDADGVVFLDPSVSGFGNLVNGSLEDFPDNKEDTNAGGIDEMAGSISGEDRPKTSEGGSNRKPCAVLGSSHGASSIDTPAWFHKTPDSLSPTFLKMLLRRFRGGMVWNFTENGEDYSDDQTFETHASDGDTGSLSTTDQSGDSRRPSQKKSAKEHLALAFPGVRSLILLGLWDPSRSQWRAGCVIWSCAPMRVFSRGGEMRYLSAFCDVIMAKLARLDVEMANNVKSDFISSISHELRSPLHGILGTVEVLQDQTYDFETNEMINQIDTCGRTLLDIVDHLLDFSKINVLAKHSGDRNDLDLQNGADMSPWGAGQKNRDPGMSSPDTNVSLDLVTEEVIESAVYSFCCSKDQHVLSERHVDISIDIEDHEDIPWNCKIHAGAWKRVCVNLINNALKYTAKGFIKVSLKIVPPANKHKRPIAQLTVEDSGRGMSKNFLQNHLFRAFTQEDTLNDGTGLGLSMVAKIVKGWKGQVNVESAKGKGSTFVVSMPMEITQGPTGADLVPTATGLERSSGYSVHVLGSAESPDPDTVAAGRKQQISSFCKMCVSMGLITTGPSWQLSGHETFNIITEREVPSLVQILTSSLADWDSKPSPSVEALQSKPLLVLCKDYMSIKYLKGTRLSQLMRGKIEYVAQPCGRRRLASAIHHILDPSRETSLPNTQSSTPITPCTPCTTTSELRDPFTPTPMMRSTTSRHDWREGSAWHDQLHRPISQELKQIDGAPSESAQLDFASPTHPEHQNRGNNPDLQSPTGLGLNYTQGLTNREDLSVMELPERPAPSLSDGPTPKAIKPKPIVKGVIDLSKPCLLLVDDNSINLKLLVTYSKKNNHAMLKATNGLEAVQAYQNPPSSSSSSSNPTRRPDVILMDINMPIMDGFEATRQIRAFEMQQGLTPATIIALTGLGSGEAQHEAFVSGINLFLTKPVRLKELGKLLDEIKNGKNND